MPNIICVYCNKPIKIGQHQQFTITNDTDKTLGALHAYCHQFVADEYDKRQFKVKTSAGTIISKKKATT